MHWLPSPKEESLSRKGLENKNPPSNLAPLNTHFYFFRMDYIAYNESLLLEEEMNNRIDLGNGQSVDKNTVARIGYVALTLGAVGSYTLIKNVVKVFNR